MLGNFDLKIQLFDIYLINNITKHLYILFL